MGLLGVEVMCIVGLGHFSGGELSCCEHVDLEGTIIQWGGGEKSEKTIELLCFLSLAFRRVSGALVSVVGEEVLSGFVCSKPKEL